MYALEPKTMKMRKVGDETCGDVVPKSIDCSPFNNPKYLVKLMLRWNVYFEQLIDYHATMRKMPTTTDKWNNFPIGRWFTGQIYHVKHNHSEAGYMILAVLLRFPALHHFSRMYLMTE